VEDYAEHETSTMKRGHEYKVVDVAQAWQEQKHGCCVEQ